MKKSGCFFVVAARSRKVVQLVQSDRWQPKPGRVSSAAAKQKQSDSIDRQQMLTTTEEEHAAAKTVFASLYTPKGNQLCEPFLGITKTTKCKNTSHKRDLSVCSRWPKER